MKNNLVSSCLLSASFFFFTCTVATPTPRRSGGLHGRDDTSTVDLSGPLQSSLDAAVENITAQGISGDQVIAAYEAAIANLTTTKAQENYNNVLSVISSAFSPTAAERRGAEIARDDEHPEILNRRQTTGVDSSSNSNTKQPTTSIYPKKSTSDAPYSLPESTLRSAIYIPSTFSYGASSSKQPVILIPGTAVPAGTTYASNLVPLLTQSTFADPVWVNIPKASLADAQVSAEYVAYAINYISAVTSRSVAVVTFSQGSVNTQWALKYWPSTRSNVSDFVALSPDFHGTVVAYVLCPLLSLLGCTPSVYQQTYASHFLSTLRAGGGDSAYVPTTTLFSSTDEIVQPQSGTAASGYLLDARAVGVSNNQVQTVCPGKVAGGVVLHEGMLYNALAWALLKDALTHDGPGSAARLDLSTVCGEAQAEGLDAADVLATEATNVNAVVNVLAYSPKVFKEPAVASYAS